MSLRRAVFFLRYWLPVLLWAGLIFALSSISGLESGLPKQWDFLLRKLGHIVEYAILTALLIRALQAHGLPPNKTLIWGALLALLYALSDEIHQSFIPGREGALRDVLIDGLGVGLVTLLFLSLQGCSFRS
jgi:VanZ family protein